MGIWIQGGHEWACILTMLLHELQQRMAAYSSHC